MVVIQPWVVGLERGDDMLPLLVKTGSNGGEGVIEFVVVE